MVFRGEEIEQDQETVYTLQVSVTHTFQYQIQGNTATKVRDAESSEIVLTN